MNSQQVSWWSTHEYVIPLLDEARSWPLIGTPAWCLLPCGDLQKVAAIFDAAQHWALRIETHQQHLADASHCISGAVDWSAVTTEMNARRSRYIPRK